MYRRVAQRLHGGAAAMNRDRLSSFSFAFGSAMLKSSQWWKWSDKLCSSHVPTLEAVRSRQLLLCDRYSAAFQSRTYCENTASTVQTTKHTLIFFSPTTHSITLFLYLHLDCTGKERANSRTRVSVFRAMTSGLVSSRRSNLRSHFGRSDAR